jgi:ankyrin repeat protein
MLGDTPLHKAATNNVPIEVLDFLIGHDNSQLFKENQLGDLPLHCATAGSASIDVIRSLVIVSSKLSITSLKLQFAH